MATVREEIERYAQGFQQILEELDAYSDWRANSIRRSIQKTMDEISKALGSEEQLTQKSRGILAGLKQGAREVPTVLDWLPPEALDRINAAFNGVRTGTDDRA